MEDTLSLQSTSSISSLECFICMEKTDDPILNILDFDLARTCRCQGCLHAKCYAQWLRTSNGCPICRKPIQIEQRENDFTIDNLPVYQVVRTNNIDLPKELIILLLIVIIFIVTIVIILFVVVF